MVNVLIVAFAERVSDFYEERILLITAIICANSIFCTNSVFAETSNYPNLVSEAAVLMDVQTRQVLFE